jgi:DNA repair exonuclease SbcCD nuclease subunit
MSKIFFIGDTHIGLGYPNSVDKWFKVHRQYFNDFLIPFLKEKVTKDDIIVHLGDLFDNRNVIPINLLNYGMDIVEEISKISPLHIIIGNHDLWSKSSSDVNSVRPFRYIPNVSIYDRTSILDFNNKRILMMPYIENRLDQISLIKKNKDCDYLFCHSDLNGCKMHLTSVAHKNPDKIDIDEFISFKRVISGHIHIVQNNKNFTFVGSLFQMDRNDMGDQKGIFVLDTETDNLEFYPNKISPIFTKVHIKNDNDVENLESLKSSNNYIDLVISNNLIINNRKVRRKLESLLESGNFASVDYLDDINNGEVSVEDNVTSEVSINLDYEDFIREYISLQKYDKKVLDGIIIEYDKIIQIYNDSYRKLNQ